MRCLCLSLLRAESYSPICAGREELHAWAVMGETQVSSLSKTADVVEALSKMAPSRRDSFLCDSPLSVIVSVDVEQKFVPRDDLPGLQSNYTAKGTARLCASDGILSVVKKFSSALTRAVTQDAAGVTAAVQPILVGSLVGAQSVRLNLPPVVGAGGAEHVAPGTKTKTVVMTDHDMLCRVLGAAAAGVNLRGDLHLTAAGRAKAAKEASGNKVRGAIPVPRGVPFAQLTGGSALAAGSLEKGEAVDKHTLKVRTKRVCACGCNCFVRIDPSLRGWLLLRGDLAVRRLMGVVASGGGC